MHWYAESKNIPEPSGPLKSKLYSSSVADNTGVLVCGSGDMPPEKNE